MSSDTLARPSGRSPAIEENEPVFLAMDESRGAEEIVFAEATDTVAACQPESAVCNGETVVAAASVAERPAWLPRRTPADESQVGEPEDVPVGEAEVPALAPPAAVEPPAPPVRRRRARKPPAPLIPIAVADEPPEELPWPEKVKRWFIGFAAMGYGLSLIVHFVLLLVLSLIVAAPKLLNPQFSINASQDEGIDTRLNEVEMGEEEASGGSEAVSAVDMARLEVARSLIAEQVEDLQPEFPSDLVNPADSEPKQGGTGKGNGEGDGKGRGKGLAFAMPSGGKAVTKGRFTAWTVPTDPEPGESYRIVIQIDLPEKMNRLPKSDLIGSFVVGTDRYRQDIPQRVGGRIAGYFPGNGKQVQVVVFVPGAAANVRDNIIIKSKILKEEQKIELVF